MKRDELLVGSKLCQSDGKVFTVVTVGESYVTLRDSDRNTYVRSIEHCLLTLSFIKHGLSTTSKKNTSNNWIQTTSGQVLFVEHPDPKSISIFDIAHALSLLCRFAGHVKVFYSVAQHCVLVYEQVLARCIADGIEGAERVELCFAALMHDATEGLGLVDIPAPIKRLVQLAGYRDLEYRMEEAVRKRFRIDDKYGDHPYIKWADLRVLATEARDLLNTPDQKWELRAEPMADKVCPVTSQEAEALFLYTYQTLSASREWRRVDG